MFYSYLNLENTKTVRGRQSAAGSFYSYLNLENTKTLDEFKTMLYKFYSYLNLENTKTSCIEMPQLEGFIVT